MDYNVKAEEVLELIEKPDSIQNFIEEAKELLKKMKFLKTKYVLYLLHNIIIAHYKENNNYKVVIYSNKLIDYILNHNQKYSIIKTSKFLESAYFKKGQALSRMKKFDEAEEIFDTYICCLFENECQIKHNGVFFSLRKIDRYSLSDLINNEITVVSPELFNDPSDCAIFDIINYNIDRTFDITALKRSYKKIKFRSFLNRKGLYNERVNNIKPTKEYIMWSHYADSHKGMCIEYNVSNNFSIKSKDKYALFFNELYTTGSINLDLIDSMRFDDAFITKQACWNYEKEIRFMYYNTNSSSEYECIPLDDESRISAIYFGLRCSEEDKRTVMKILENRNVAFYQMKKNPENIYDLVEVEIFNH